MELLNHEACPQPAIIVDGVSLAVKRKILRFAWNEGVIETASNLATVVSMLYTPDGTKLPKQKDSAIKRYCEKLKKRPKISSIPCTVYPCPRIVPNLSRPA